jgi:hypothetical protein
MNEEIKLFLAKGSWVNYVHHYYFEDTLGENFEHLNNLEIKDSLEFFTDHINKGLSLNKKDWINYLINEGWSKDEEDVNDTWFNLKEKKNENI